MTPRAGRPRALPDTADLPGTALSGQQSLLEIAPGGIVLGYSDIRADGRAGRGVAVPLVCAAPTRAVVAGELDLFVQIASRIVGAGVHLTVVTDRPAPWEALRRRTDPGRCAIAGRLDGWPGSAPSWPRLLLVDRPEPPGRTAVERAPWSTVVHVSTALPSTPDWWRAADLLMIGGQGYGAAVAAIHDGRADLDVAAIDALRPPQLAVIDPTETRILTTVPTRAEAELAQEVRSAASRG